MNEEMKAAAQAVVEAWKGISEEGREKFNDAAGSPLVDALRGLGSVLESESGAQTGQVSTGAAGDVCTLDDGSEGVLEDQGGNLVCVAKAQ